MNPLISFGARCRLLQDVGCSGGFLGLHWTRFGAGNRRQGVPQVEILQILVLELSLGEQNVVPMQLLLVILACFAASLIGLFLFLRFKPNLLFALFGS